MEGAVEMEGLAGIGAGRGEFAATWRMVLILNFGWWERLAVRGIYSSHIFCQFPTEGFSCLEVN